MRNHGWELPYHPLQTVAVAVFSGISFSFYVFFIPFVGNRLLTFHIYAVFSSVVLAVFILYVRCAGCDPADVGVRQSKRAVKAILQRAALNAIKASEQNETRGETGPERGGKAAGPSAGCVCIIPFACCSFGESESEAKVDSGEQLLFCSICQAEISTNSKHCKACDKCVHGFDHHCRWLNNCVGKRNYRAFVSLMMASLLLLIMVWATGIGVLVRCFSEKTQFEKEILHRLGSSFSRQAYIIVVVLLSLLAMLATIPLCQLFVFHLILVHKGITTYDYILAVREGPTEVADYGEHSGEGIINSLTSSPASSNGTGSVSAGFSSAAGASSLHNRGIFCTPPRMFVEHHQKVVDSRAGDVESSTSKLRTNYPAAAARRQPQQKTSIAAVNPWTLARMNPAARDQISTISKASSSQLTLTETEDSSLDLSSRDVSGEIATRAPYVTGNERWLLMKDNRRGKDVLRCFSPCSSSPDTTPGTRLKVAEDDEPTSLVRKYKSTVTSTSVVVTSPNEEVAVWEDGRTRSGGVFTSSTLGAMVAVNHQSFIIESPVAGPSSESRAEANILKHVRKEHPYLKHVILKQFRDGLDSVSPDAAENNPKITEPTA